MAMLCIWPDPRPTGAAAAHDAVTPSSRWSCAVVGLAARHDHRWHRGGTCSDALNLPLANGESPQTPSASGGPGRAMHCSLMDALPCPALPWLLLLLLPSPHVNRPTARTPSSSPCW
jgi:hypothetical protein